MPASVFSRSTECHNQDKVSMGTIAARDCLRVLELTEQVVAAHADRRAPGHRAARAASTQRLALGPRAGATSRPTWKTASRWSRKTARSTRDLQRAAGGDPRAGLERCMKP